MRRMDRQHADYAASVMPQIDRFPRAIRNAINARGMVALQEYYNRLAAIR